VVTEVLMTNVTRALPCSNDQFQSRVEVKKSHVHARGEQMKIERLRATKVEHSTGLQNLQLHFRGVL
jgi:hypothetical protein